MQFHPFTTRTGLPEGQRMGDGGCFDRGLFRRHISNQRVAKRFHSSLPQQDPWLHWYYSWRKQSLLGKVSSCWVRRLLGLWNANKERFSRLDEKICHEIGSPEGEKALTIAPSFADFGSVPEERLVHTLNANIRFSCWRRQIVVRIHVPIFVFIAKSPSFPQMWCDVIPTLPPMTTNSGSIANCNMYRSAVSCVSGWLADALFHIFHVHEEARKRLVVFPRRKLKVMQLSVNDSSCMSLRACSAAESAWVTCPLASYEVFPWVSTQVCMYMRATAPERTVSIPEILRTATCAQIITSIGG